MAGPKAKSSSATGPIKKSKSAPSTNGTSSPVPPPAAATPDGSETVHNYGPGKPDKSIYDAEQEKVKAEIEAVQVKLVCYVSHPKLTPPKSTDVSMLVRL